MNLRWHQNLRTFTLGTRAFDRCNSLSTQRSFSSTRARTYDMPVTNPRPQPPGYRNRNNKGLGSSPGEDMDVCKCIVSLRHVGTLNSRRAASPLVWLVEGEERMPSGWRSWLGAGFVQPFAGMMSDQVGGFS
ncbi:hypothetical protein TNCV_3599841 [Trichonephila clavipes]|nr:hypothetical protein TNCV_3599841 [Trichonephila clavipes]